MSKPTRTPLHVHLHFHHRSKEVVYPELHLHLHDEFEPGPGGQRKPEPRTSGPKGRHGSVANRKKKITASTAASPCARPTRVRFA